MCCRKNSYLILEHNTYIWSPTDAGGITKLERVQRHFTKRILYVTYLAYCDRLKTLGLESLELRRLRYDLIMLHKIVHNLADLDRDSLSSSAVTRNSYLKICKPTCLFPARYKFLRIRSIIACNFLSEERAGQSIPCFKRKLISHDLSKFIECF